MRVTVIGAERARPIEKSRSDRRDAPLLVRVRCCVGESAANENLERGAHRDGVPVARRHALEVLVELADDLGPKSEDRVELATNRLALSVAHRANAEQPGHEVADVRREPHQEIGDCGRRHALAEARSIVSILAVKVCVTGRELG